MPVAIALICGVAILAWMLVGLIWTLVLLVPFYGYVALSLFWIARSQRKHAQAAALLAREAEQQRLLNEQEFKAWQSAAEDTRRKTAKRDRALRQFDARNPPRQ